MRSAEPRKVPAKTELAGVDDLDLASSQEAVPVHLVIGTRVVPAKWISPIYNPYAIQREERAK